ncbi:MAG: hypothetical protein R2771_00250 [Saprospiraceae bacterium]
MFGLFFLSLITMYSQNSDALDLLDDISKPEAESLLPQKMLFTQSILWGNKGLMRNFNRFELTSEKRQRELKLRRGMLVGHQIGGMVTLGGMVAQGIVGTKLYNGDIGIKKTHEALALLVNTTYFTTAGLALFAPPKVLDDRKGYSSIKLHKYLAAIHLTGMIATNVLAGQLEAHPNLRPYHRAAAFTSFAALAAAMIVIKF